MIVICLVASCVEYRRSASLGEGQAPRAAHFQRGEADNINNWVIVRSDGTGEGNFVGKFLDGYNPK